VAYDILSKVFSELPVGDPLQREVVFKGSIPEKFRVGTQRPTPPCASREHPRAPER